MTSWPNNKRQSQLVSFFSQRLQVEVTERDRQIETLLAQVEADKVGVILDILANVHSIPESDTFSYQHDKLPGVVWTPIDIWLLSGAPNVNFRKISVGKTIWDL